MYMVFVKENGRHTVTGIAESMDEVKTIIVKYNLKSKIETGKAYLMEGQINLIRPEITPELLDLKVTKKEKDLYY
jgi:hypothetical protein